MNEGEIDAEGILRIIAFFVGLGLLISGFIDLGRLGGIEVRACPCYLFSL